MRTLAAWVAVAVIVAAAQSQALAAKDFPTHVDFQETGARWETLPEAVKHVFVQDGKRVWYELDNNSDHTDLASIERIIRAEFEKPAPQLYGAGVQLFETGGRVWFRNHAGTVLISYDGKDLKEYPVEEGPRDKHFYVGICPNTRPDNGERLGPNCQVGGTVFIAESCGVFTATGERTDYHRMTDVAPLERGGLNYPRLVPEPDGQGALASMAVRGRLILHRWREGRWTEIDVPQEFPADKAISVAPWVRGAMVFCDGRVNFVPYERVTMKVFHNLVARLGDKEFKVREEATQELMALAPILGPNLNTVRKETQDPEIRARLDRALAVSEPRQGEPRIGDIELKEPHLALSEAGWMYVGASKIYEDGRDLGRGTVLFKPDGKYRIFAGDDFYYVLGWDTRPLVVKEHALLWTHDGNHGGAHLLDVEKGKFVASPPDPNKGRPQAVKSDGTVYMNTPGVFRPSVEDLPPAAP